MQSNDFYQWMENPGLLNHETGLNLKKLTEEFPYFQAGWVLYLQNLKNTGNPAYEAALKKAAVRIPDRKQLYRILNSGFTPNCINPNVGYSETLHQKFNLNFSEEQNSGNSLIDKFLASNPGKIQRKIGSDEIPEIQENEEILKSSVLETDEIITETLATIYQKQKKYDKALEAFRKLSLKYPEKSVYFAARIEEIEKLKNI